MTKLSLAVLTFVISNSLYAQSIDKIQAKQLQERQKHQEEVKAAMKACTALTQDGDVRGRNLSRNVQVELGETCVVQKPSLDSIKLLNKQINNAFQVVDATELWSDVNTIALKRTAKSVWATHMKLIKDEKLNETSAVNLICKYTPKLCKDKVDLRSIKLAFQSFQQETAKKPVKFLTGPEQAAILKNELQPLIARANKTCEATKKKYNDIKLAHSCLRLPVFTKGKDGKLVMGPKVKPMTTGECQGQVDAAYAKHRQLQAIATQSIEMDMQLIVGSQLGSLLITEDLRNKMGVLKNDFAYESCMKGDGSILKQVWNKDLIKARNDFYALTVKELKKIDEYKSEDSSDYSKKQTLKQYLKTNPSTVAELLNHNPDKNKAYAMCSLIKTIQGWDKAGKIVDGVIIGTGVVASIALGFTGVGAPAGAALAGVVLGSSALTVAKSAIDYSSQIHQDERLRSAVATKQKDFDQALDELKVSDNLKEGYLNNIKFTVAAEAVGFGLGKGLKYLATLKQAKSVSILAHGGAAAGAAKVISNEEKLAAKLENGAKLMRSSVEKGGAKAAHLTKINPTQEAKLAALYSNLDAVKAEALTKKLASLKTSGEIDKFLLNAEKNIAGLKSGNFKNTQLARMVDESKDIPPLKLRVQTGEKTGQVYAKAGAAEQKRMTAIAANFKKKLKLPEEEILEKMAKLQKNCLTKGVVKTGCLQTNLSKLERELSDTLLLNYMNATQKTQLAKAAKLEQSLKASTDPIVYDAVFIGAGPHNSIALNAFREANPKLRALVIEASEDFGVFDALKGFDINTPEFLKKSGNTYPASAVQLRDFNLSKRVYASAEDLGDLTQAAYLSADADMIFKNRVVKWSKEPTPGAWPAPHKIETSTGLTIYTHADIAGTGFGNPITRLKDPASIELVGKFEKELKATNLATNATYAPKAISVDDFVALAADDVAAGRSAMARYKGKKVLMIGSGDGGNIGIEAAAGLNPALNPKNMKAEVETIWLGQESPNGAEFLKTLNDRKINRYGKIAKSMDDGAVKPVNGYLARVEEFKTANGETKFKAYYTTKEGTPIAEPMEVDHLVFSTGYPNDPKTISPLFEKMAKSGNVAGDEIAYADVAGRVDDFTPYDHFKGEGNISKQVTINGKPENVYLVGNVAKVHIGSGDWAVPTGGLIDINGPRSAATGKLVAEQISAQKGMTNIHTVLKSEPGKVAAFKIHPSVVSQKSTLLNDLPIANVDMKIQLNRSLREFKTAPNAEFGLHFTKNKAGDYYITVKGLDQKSSAEIVTALSKNPDLINDLKSFSSLKQNSVEVKLMTRSNGQIKFETVEMSRIVASKTK